MAEIRKYINALRQCAKEHKKDITPTFQIRVSDLCEDTAKLLENDVVERSKIDKAIAEICKINPVNKDGYKNCDDIKFEVLEILKRNIGE